MAFEIRVPRLGWSMEEGTFAGWLKKEGETVQSGEPLFSLEGEKATQDIESLDSGILRIHPEAPAPGKVIAVGTLLGVIVPVGASHSWTTPGKIVSSEGNNLSQTKTTGDLAPASPSVRRLARQMGIALEEIQGTGKGGRILADDLERKSSQIPNKTKSSKSEFATPRAKKRAQSLGIDWRMIQGTGRGGRVRERDLKSTPTDPNRPFNNKTQEDWITLPLTPIRKRIAERLCLSRQTTVPVTLTTKADATQLIALRSQFKNAGGLVPAFTDILGKLAALCLIRHPIMGGRWTENEIIHPGPGSMHIGIAVDTNHGLLVPVIRDMVNSSLLDIAKESKTKSELARQGKLSADAMRGGVFTISSLGSLGIEFFTPVINPPESAILGLGTILNEAVPREDGTIVAQKRLPLSLTFDHRVVDGAPAARFLKDLVLMIENPAAVLLTAQG